jgi:hypothetical protein
MSFANAKAKEKVDDDLNWCPAPALAAVDRVSARSRCKIELFENEAEARIATSRLARRKSGVDTVCRSRSLGTRRDAGCRIALFVGLHGPRFFGSAGSVADKE